MKNKFLISLIGGLAPIVILTIIALTQLGKYSYTELGGTIVWIQAGYVVLLLPTAIVLFILKKKEIVKGVLVSFGIGFLVAIITLGMGL